MIVIISSVPAYAAPALPPPRPEPLTEIPAAELRRLAPILRSSDLALFESNERGAMKQVSAVTLVAAPPSVARDVVMHAERYPEFVRNMDKSVVRHEPEGTFLHSFVVNYRIYSIVGNHRYVPLPARPGESAGRVQMYDADPGGVRNYIWEFVPVGNGTVVVLYGFAPIPGDRVMGPFLEAVPTLEYGLALTSQMALLLSVKARAQALAGKIALGPVGSAGAGDYQTLLTRGAVAILRTVEGRLIDISLVHRVQAPLAKVMRVAGDVGQWSAFVPSLKRSTPTGNQGVEIEQRLPLMMTWTTGYGVRTDPRSVDLFALSGDLGGGRLRLDGRELGERTELVFRSNQQYHRTSVVLRQLYKLEPLFEQGMSVGMHLVVLEAIKRRAEALQVLQR